MHTKQGDLVYCSDHAGALCRIAENGGHEPLPRALLAAAPDLLEACKAMVGAANDECFSDAKAEARAAIKKAQGEP